MGLSSSQARLLNLTARMHQIEYKAARLEAMKLQMANESTRVYEDYLDALDKTKIQIKVLNTDGSVTYQDMTNYTDFTNAGYALNYNGVVYDGSTVAFKTKDGSKYVSTTGKTATAADVTNKTYGPNTTLNTVYHQALDGSGYFAATDVTTGDANKITLNFARLCADAFGADPAAATPTGPAFETVITNLINSGDVTIVTRRKDTGEFAKETEFDFADYETSVSTNTGLQEVTDDVALKKAEAKYEADMKKIDMKDRKYDTDLAALDTERNAIKQEMDTLKTVAKENVERTFKLFG